LKTCGKISRLKSTGKMKCTEVRYMPSKKATLRCGHESLYGGKCYFHLKDKGGKNARHKNCKNK